MILSTSFLRLATLLSVFSVVLASSSAEPFNPRSYKKEVATCKAVHRAEGKDVDIDIHYVDINPEAEQTMIFVHGWPSLWSSWKYQIEEFKDDYRLLVPDLRGFGSSTHPDDVKSSGNMGDMVSDLVCVLEKAGVEKAICVGHDWGSQICYEAARSRPDIFTAIVGIAIPYIPSHGPFIPIAALTTQLPRLSYQIFFDSATPAAIAELEKDVRRTLRGTLRTVETAPPSGFLESRESFLEGWREVGEIDPIPFFTPDEEDYWVEQYAIQGFRNTLQFYTTENRKASWKIAHDHGNHTIPQPVLSILPDQDPVANWVLAAKLLHSADFLPDYEMHELHGAHWVHLENPVETNKVMRSWLEGLEKRGTRATEEEAVGSSDGKADEERVKDEL
ncbi:alpha/beta-hydrolase [Stereum hirsutum FP-91666 SS1]|uniref:alpha/beta-hydrolase n=1 Tax=Stereum hirsutum (strain FP-91666) TaxID=721885 RepID=UPI0004449372|nr:alpha/beta-hydrolase [Stereum hirsutum FP-91666 SS1]EIM85309.1 alpha/beta-hydrolase [Stereum hirsutum FP-91666 SS1]